MRKNVGLYLEEFADQILKGKFEIYNEASVQFELATFLRRCLKEKYKVQVERNINDFDLKKKKYSKKEYSKKIMDIVVFTRDEKLKHCIELKYPTKGQYPIQMYSVCKDVKFLEELVDSCFCDCYFMMFAKDHLFYTEEGKKNGIYKKFRKDKMIKGKVKDPANGSKQRLIFKGKYKIKWHPQKNKQKKDALRYFIINVAA